jgi:acetyltransferase-like isoleucine patch superfamily enzyme
MSIKKKLTEKINVLSIDYFDRPARTPSERRLIYWVLIKTLAGWGIDLLNGWVRLRKCTTGKMVTVKGRLKVNAKGAIIIGDFCRIWSNIGTTQLSTGPRALIDIGENTFINSGAIITSRRHIRIGKNCHIANQVIMMDDDFHDVYARGSKSGKEAIIVGDNVWIATRAMILKGVTIGEGAVVAAGAVVTKDVAPYTLVGGVPARVLKYLDDPDEPADWNNAEWNNIDNFINEFNNSY